MVGHVRPICEGFGVDSSYELDRWAVWVDPVTCVDPVLQFLALVIGECHLFKIAFKLHVLLRKHRQWHVLILLDDVECREQFKNCSIG